MFISDLSLVCSTNSSTDFLTEYLRPSCLAVGWLDERYEYATGPTASCFRQKLHRLCTYPVDLTRGFHICPFCVADAARGNGQIHVKGLGNKVYLAPTLISHYVQAHNYRPPDEFITAVETASEPEVDIPPDSLSVRVLALADTRSPGNRDAFYAAFVSARVGAEAPSELGPIPPGDYVLSGTVTMRLPLGGLPGGDPAIMVWADIRRMARRAAGTRFMEIAALDVAKLAVVKNAGIIVQACVGNRWGWAGIPRRDVKKLIRGS